MRMLRALLVSLTLAMGGVLIPPVVVPSTATTARAAILYGYTTDGVFVYQWIWVPIANNPDGGKWVMINITPSLGI